MKTHTRVHSPQNHGCISRISASSPFYARQRHNILGEGDRNVILARAYCPLYYKRGGEHRVGVSQCTQYEFEYRQGGSRRLPNPHAASATNGEESFGVTKSEKGNTTTKCYKWSKKRIVRLLNRGRKGTNATKC